MNAMDIYDFDDAAPSPTPGAAASSGDTATTDKGTTSSITEQPSLNEEVQQALGSLGSWWGGFRKQSVVALASARKDLGQVVQQAQREIGKLATQPSSAPTSPRASTSMSEPSTSETANTAVDTTGDVKAAASTSVETITDSEDTNTTSTSAERSTPATATSTSTSPSASNSLFSFLPTNIAQNLTSTPTNIQTTFQRTLATPEIQNLRSSISTNLTTLQSTVQSSISTAQSTVQSSVQSVQSNPQVQNLASSVQHLPASVGNLNLTIDSVDRFVMEKGEEFWKGAGEFFREAVKIVPPSEEEVAARERSMGGMGGMGMFDGVGVWGFDDLGGDGDGEEEKGGTEDGKGKAVAGAGAGAGVAVSRTAALLKQLRGDPDLLRVDPLQGGEEGKGAETFEWFLKQLEAKGASVGSEAWVGKCVSEEGLFEELRVTREVLVPAEMDETTFWKRYWFRAWQIREAEEKRKALLQATSTPQKEEDFAWEDEEDETAGADRTETQTPMNQSQSTLAPTLGVTIPESASAAGGSAEMKASHSDEKKPAVSAAAGASSSPRESSEDSYDLVSTRSGNASGTALAVPALTSVLEKEEGKSKRAKKEGDEEEDSGDSDWE